MLLALVVASLAGCAVPPRPTPRPAASPEPTALATPAPAPTARPLPYETLARAAAQRYLELDTQREHQDPDRAGAEAREWAAALRVSAERDPQAHRPAAAELAQALDLLAQSFAQPTDAPRLIAQARAHYAAFLSQPLRQSTLALPTSVPGYRVRGETATTYDGLPAREVRVEVDPWLTAGDIAAVLVAALRSTRERSGAAAVVVYAYWSGDDPAGPFTAGRASYACGSRTWLGYPPDCTLINLDLVTDREAPLARLHRTVPYAER